MDVLVTLSHFSESWGLRVSVSFPSSFCSRPNFLEELGRKRLLRRSPVEVLACTDQRDDYGNSEK